MGMETCRACGGLGRVPWDLQAAAGVYYPPSMLGPIMPANDEEEERRSQAEFVEWRPPGVAQLATERLPFVAGSAWFIRTVTYHLVGVVTGRYEHFLTLKDASWVADSGRFTQAIKEGKLSEVEPVGEAVVNLDSIVDAFPWTHPLPMEQK